MRTEQRVAGSWGDMDARQAGVEVSRCWGVKASWSAGLILKVCMRANVQERTRQQHLPQA